MTEPGDATDPQPERPVAAPAGWTRLHPLTPVIRGWAVLVGSAFIGFQSWGRDLLSGDGLPAGMSVLIPLAVLLVIVLVAAGYGTLAWRMTRYRVGDEAVELHHGVLFRQQRQARLDRLQAVDVVQPLLGRIVGLAELKLEVAGGSGSDVKLGYLREPEAQRLRTGLLARAAGAAPEGEEDAPEVESEDLLSVPLGRLVVSILRSSAFVVAVVFVVGLVVAALVMGTPTPLIGAFPALVASVGALWSAFSRGFGFSVATSADGLRLRHGLLESRAQTVPPGRVQAVRLSQPPLWRGRDWWRVDVNVAGYGGGTDTTQSTVLLPVGDRDEAVWMLSLVLPDLGVSAEEGARAVVDAGLTGTGDHTGFTGPPRQARWVDPIAWRRNGFRITERAFLARRGRVFRQLDVVPHEKTQSIGVAQGPVQRRLGVASMLLHSTDGPVKPSVAHLSLDVLAELVPDQAHRARQAREHAAPERWRES